MQGTSTFSFTSTVFDMMQDTSTFSNLIFVTVTYAPPKSGRFLLKEGLNPNAFQQILTRDLASLKLPMPSLKRTKVIADGSVVSHWPKKFNGMKTQFKQLDPEQPNCIKSDALRSLRIAKIELHAYPSQKHLVIEDSQNPVTNYLVNETPSFIPPPESAAQPLERKRDEDQHNPVDETLSYPPPESSATRSSKRKRDDDQDNSVDEIPSSPSPESLTARLSKRKRDDDQDNPVDEAPSSPPPEFSAARLSKHKKRPRPVREAAKEARRRIKESVNEEERSEEESEAGDPQLNTPSVASRSVPGRLRQQHLLRIEDLERRLEIAQSNYEKLQNEHVQVSQMLETKEIKQRDSEAWMQDQESRLNGLINELQKMSQDESTTGTELQDLRRQLLEARIAREKCEEPFKAKIRRLEERLEDEIEDRHWAEDALDYEREKMKEEKEARHALREEFLRLQTNSQETEKVLNHAQAALKSATKQAEEAQTATDRIRSQSEKREAADEAARLCRQEESKRQHDEIEKLTKLLRDSQNSLHLSEEARECDRKGQVALTARHLELEEMLRVEKMNRERTEDALCSLQQEYRGLEADKIAQDEMQDRVKAELELLRKRAKDAEEALQGGTSREGRSEDGLPLQQGHVYTCHEESRTIDGFGTQPFLGHLFK
ncbi:hypothetical protein K435DRAFT_972724 [Dendrothele bispora CBS 962.96]|uniref:Uncharacterized protein n=1 Tax=Dendrothele bispora (strain CBS 962.96) TaxID=1314807 RepID=A0A4S8KXJ6_DENBC|nr:hypothetical protein K435DRAFT_972724 [Dendrothele bispora CBS 962.96]